jgi:hypothetical protein
MPESPVPAYIASLIRHFEDLRDGTHGAGPRVERTRKPISLRFLKFNLDNGTQLAMADHPGSWQTEPATIVYVNPLLHIRGSCRDTPTRHAGFH